MKHRITIIYLYIHIPGVLLTIISLMRALDPLKYEVQTMDYVEKLIAVDPMRTNYYRDISKFNIFPQKWSLINKDTLRI